MWFSAPELPEDDVTCCQVKRLDREKPVPLGSAGKPERAAETKRTGGTS